ncbi:MAG TPA: hypothetical protein PK668_02160 [Myxococcota bacterium]|nr:hypothetical protein [Myxococcota bacterium]HRY94627.1 hypothetical protein [Myxococcota bacterium]HSA21488.1 hypothetical protein [Myxococcota bacterium]
MRVQNVNGKHGPTCSCGSWLEHWMATARRRVAFCPVRGCFEPVAAGARVQKEGAPDGRWYVVPLCKQHDARAGAALELIDSALLVPADDGESCGR